MMNLVVKTREVVTAHVELFSSVNVTIECET